MPLLLCLYTKTFDLPALALIVFFVPEQELRASAGQVFQGYPGFLVLGNTQQLHQLVVLGIHKSCLFLAGQGPGEQFSQVPLAHAGVLLQGHQDLEQPDIEIATGIVNRSQGAFYVAAFVAQLEAEELALEYIAMAHAFIVHVDQVKVVRGKQRRVGLFHTLGHLIITELGYSIYCHTSSFCQAGGAGGFHTAWMRVQK